jgi:hypothetical protein
LPFEASGYEENVDRPERATAKFPTKDLVDHNLAVNFFLRVNLERSYANQDHVLIDLGPHLTVRSVVDVIPTTRSQVAANEALVVVDPQLLSTGCPADAASIHF